MKIDKRKCDRCEQEYEPHPNILPDTTIIPAMYVKVQSGFFGNTLKLEIKDTCDDCLKRLQDWWDNIGS